MADRPKISIVTASKNGGRFLRQSLDSITGQSFTDYEQVNSHFCDYLNLPKLVKL
jgi:hypothetical protein